MREGDKYRTTVFFSRLGVAYATKCYISNNDGFIIMIIGFKIIGENGNVLVAVYLNGVGTGIEIFSPKKMRELGARPGARARGDVPFSLEPECRSHRDTKLEAGIKSALGRAPS